MERPYSEGKQHQLVMWITKRYKLKIVQVYARTTSNKEADVNSFYSDVVETSGKPNYYTIVMRDFNVQIGKRAVPMEMAVGKYRVQIEKRNRRHLGRMGNMKKAQNQEYHVPKESKQEMECGKAQTV